MGRETGAIMGDFPFIESTTESIRVWLSTPNYVMEGNLHLARAMKESRRLSNLLNTSDRRFVALTKVKVRDRQTGVEDESIHPFVHVNLSTVEVIRPLPEETKG